MHVHSPSLSHTNYTLSKDRKRSIANEMAPPTNAPGVYVVLYDVVCACVCARARVRTHEFIPIESVMSVAGIFSYTCKRRRRQKTPRICKKSTENIAQECCHKTLTSELKKTQGNTRER